MANNLFISYELSSASSTMFMEKVMRTLGNWAVLHERLWFIKTELGAAETARRIFEAMSPRDTLVVIDSSSNEAVWYNLRREVEDYLALAGGFAKENVVL